MDTLISARQLVGYSIRATDGGIGFVQELYFDDATWVIRYLVLDVDSWFLHRHVLLSPRTLGTPDAGQRIITASVTREQVQHSPTMDTDKPIVLQYQAQLHKHYGWEFYWGAEAMIGSSDNKAFSPLEPVNTNGKPFDPHLRTTRVVIGHQVQAQDGIAGAVDDFLLDEAAWTIRYVAVRMDDGRRIALPTQWIRQIRLETSLVYVDEPIEKIRGCLPADPMTGEKELTAASRHL